jgi:hypothetical protein
MSIANTATNRIPTIHIVICQDEIPLTSQQHKGFIYLGIHPNYAIQFGFIDVNNNGYQCELIWNQNNSWKFLGNDDIIYQGNGIDSMRHKIFQLTGYYVPINSVFTP